MGGPQAMSTPAGHQGAAPRMGSNRFSRQKTKGGWFLGNQLGGSCDKFGNTSLITCLFIFRSSNEYLRVIINSFRFYPGMRANYVDVLAGSTKKTSISGTANLFDVLPKSQSVPANMFIPPGETVKCVLVAVIFIKIICSYSIVNSVVNVYFYCLFCSR